MSRYEQPKGLLLLFATGTLERFSYFGMRAVFVLYLIAAFYSNDIATQFYGSFTGLLFLTPFFGAWMAERYLGNTRSVIIGGVLMALGHLLMFVSASSVNQCIFQKNGLIDPTINNTFSEALIYIALFLLIIGNGFFRPNLTSLVNTIQQGKPKNRNSNYSIFFLSINIAAFAAPLVCGLIGTGSWMNPENFRWSFLATTISITLGLILFISFKDQYLIDEDGNLIGDSVEQKETVKEVKVKKDILEEEAPLRSIICGILGVLLFLLFSLNADNINDFIAATVYSLAIALPLYTITDGSLSNDERKNVGVIYAIALFITIFWAAFEQAGSALTLVAEQYSDRSIGGWEIPTPWLLAVTPAAALILAPVMNIVWKGLARVKLNPSPMQKLAIALGCTSVGFLIMAFGLKNVGFSIRISIFWLVVFYLIQSFSELSLSPVSLVLIRKLSPTRLVSHMTGIWFMCIATGYILAGDLARILPQVGKAPKEILGLRIEYLQDYFIFFAVLTAVACIVLVLALPLIRRTNKKLL